MAFVSVTRLHLRSWRYYPVFALDSLRSASQAKRSRGFLGGFLGGDAQRGAWTVTLWESAADMRAFRNTGAHLKAMPRLLGWCDEASFTHWDVEAAEVPSAAEAYARLRDSGNPSKVNSPSSAHRAGRTVAEDPPRPAVTLRPRR
jgi:hypothetical protein